MADSESEASVSVSEREESDNEETRSQEPESDNEESSSERDGDDQVVNPVVPTRGSDDEKYDGRRRSSPAGSARSADGSRRSPSVEREIPGFIYEPNLFGSDGDIE
jgi:hypothetical protein